MTSPHDYGLIRSAAVLAAVAPRGVVAVSGRDRATYLHGLLTNDIAALGPGTGCYAAWLTANGRMTTDMHVLEAGDMILLDVPAAQAADVVARLDQFIFTEDVQVAEVHDCFTPTELVLMEDLGFSDRGHGWKDVLDGTFDLDGELPVNPDGGLKSFGHPIGASGLRMLFECWLQLRGEAGPRQISSIGAGKNRALTHNLGGSPGACVSFVSVVGTELG